MPRRYVPSPERNSDDSETDEDTSGPDTIKVYVWEIGDLSSLQPAFPAALPADLELVRDWRPDYDSMDPEEIDFPWVLKSIYFPQYEGCPELEHTEDVEGKTRDMAKLFSPYFQNRREIFARAFSGIDPPTHPSALMELTVAKRRPKSGPFAKVQICAATLDNEGGFEAFVERYDEHPLYEQGYKWATAVEIDRDPVKLNLVQLLMQGYLLDLLKIYPLPPDEDEPENDEFRVEGNQELSGEEDEKLSPEETRARRKAAIEDWVQRGWLVCRT